MSTPRPRPLPQAALPVNTHHMVPKYYGAKAAGYLCCQYCERTDVTTQETCSLHPSEQRRVSLAPKSVSPDAVEERRVLRQEAWREMHGDRD